MLRLELLGISKQYPAVKANDGVSLRVAPGQIHAVLGENGAGKSTLMKIIYGAVRPDAGEMVWDGRQVQIASPAQARQLGISMVYQHFSLFDTLTAAENVWLGLDKSLSLAEVTVRIVQVAKVYGLEVDPQRPVHSLSVGERQRVEIVRALLTDPKLLILDEPTSVLTPQAVETLFVTLRQLAERGCSILYISHKLDEIRALCHHCTVLRGGKVTGEVDPRTVGNADLSRLMIGAEPPKLQHIQARLGDVALQVSGLTLAKQSPFGTDLKDIGFEVKAGEIVGVAGVSGNGQQELMAALSGEDPRAPLGAVKLFGHDIGRQPPRARRALGLHFVPEERLGRGAVPTLSLAANTLLTRTEAVGRGGWLHMARVHRLAESLIRTYNVKAGGPKAAAKSLSGGNLQKFIVGREIDARPKLLIVSQPTWGVDVGAAAQIRGALLKLRDEGCAVLVVSEELDELFEISDRLLVIAQGRLSPSVATMRTTVELIGEWMSGLWPKADTANGEALHHA
ncbi:ABC transporter ATP-binding protein [Methylibium petroleiphilum]|uniref:Putative sugar ATP binding ABC transporter protein n=1 Tax=Methylibium petroleiphilum (strain ATCC BAA-1232 / LMG 22953 / PM1) TaxID=420662 RepID=A2SDX6_METPP|nr:ABC transporter ATP-binding protein [Methylibium petroleiphilum]ABM93765.1 putative sugar ATP binding ABC transporter protein [Methylibium petroleiphilum PM1]